MQAYYISRLEYNNSIAREDLKKSGGFDDFMHFFDANLKKYFYPSNFN